MATDYTSTVGQVRLLTADLGATPIMSDELLQGYLALNDQDVLLASADALEAVATSEVLVSKVIKTQDLSTDGPAVAADLRKQAASLRARHAVKAEAEQEVFFGVEGTYTGRAEAEEYRL
jgi:hypothetical protein